MMNWISGTLEQTLRISKSSSGKGLDIRYIYIYTVLTFKYVAGGRRTPAPEVV